MGVDKPLQQRGAGSCVGSPFQPTGVDARTLIHLPSPAVPDRRVAEPENSVLFPGAANKGVVYLRVGQCLRRFRADEGVVALLDEVMPEAEGNERAHVISEVVAEPLEMPLEVEILPRAVLRRRALLMSEPPDVAPVLFAVVEPEETVAQFPLQPLHHTRRRLVIAPGSLKRRTRNVPPEVEQPQLTPAHLLNKIPEVLRENRRIERPYHPPQSRVHIPIQLLAERDEFPVLDAESAECGELGTVFERLPCRHPHVISLVIRVLGRVEEVRVVDDCRHRIGDSVLWHGCWFLRQEGEEVWLPGKG
ncbi:MAG: hypothetical protein BWY06_01931 [Candidatus Latescibacteria bacterium ADurb.Bin168]|nr:MAG: hypothetical protein BWY06_01931 [Candidatus Latescibacteria bacterium ADurb.Bin168]